MAKIFLKIAGTENIIECEIVGRVKGMLSTEGVEVIDTIKGVEQSVAQLQADGGLRLPNSSLGQNGEIITPNAQIKADGTITIGNTEITPLGDINMANGSLRASGAYDGPQGNISWDKDGKFHCKEINTD